MTSSAHSAPNLLPALIVAAHGSRRAQSNQSVSNLTRALGACLNGEFSDVRHAFLEFASPDIPSTVDDLVANGAKKIIVLPYFLSEGHHVSRDIPEIVNAKLAQYTDVSIEVLPHFGSDAGILPLLAQSLKSR